MASIKSQLLPAALLLLAAAGFAPLHGAEAANPFLISGVVPCAIGNSINVAAVPVFPNAVVQVVSGGKVIAGATADGNGAFTINMGAALGLKQLLVSIIDGACKVVVDTPLAACNASLADVTGTLAAPVQIVGAAAGSLGGGGIAGLLALIEQLLSGILSIGMLPFSLV